LLNKAVLNFSLTKVLYYKLLMNEFFFSKFTKLNLFKVTLNAIYCIAIFNDFIET
jgi:hypothetical protein